MNKEKIYTVLGKVADYAQVGGAAFGMIMAGALIVEANKRGINIGEELTGIFLAAHGIVGFETAIDRISGKEIE
jgi:hypothetical protein